MVHPYAVHDYARGQRIIFAGDCLCKIQAAAAICKGRGLTRRQATQKMRRRFNTHVVRIPAHKHMGRLRFGNILYHHRAWSTAVVGIQGPHDVVAVLEIDGVVPVSLGHHQVKVADRDIHRRAIAAKCTAQTFLPGIWKLGGRIVA